jgi:hypothetical protein
MGHLGLPFQTFCDEIVLMVRQSNALTQI